MFLIRINILRELDKIMRKKWDDTEIAILLKDYPLLPKQYLEKKLNRSWKAIILKAYKLGIKRMNSIKVSARDKTNLAKYGHKNVSQKEEIKEKKKKTLLENYGVKNPSQHDDIQKKKIKTSLLRYGCMNPSQHEDIKEKVRKTCLNKYQGVAPSCNTLIQYKISKTNLERFGKKCVFENEDIKKKINKNIQKKYKVDNVSQSTLIKEKKKQTLLINHGVEYSFQSKKIQNKSKKTCFKKYGVDFYSKTKEFKDKSKKTCLERYGFPYPLQSKEILKKVHLTKKRNGTYSTSKPEENLYRIIQVIFPNYTLTRQHSSDSRYPFACDFYIKELDLFIELQGHWTHGKEPYNGDNIPNSWLIKSKESLYYKNSINIYTIRDPLKREYAQKYQLNYLEIWKEDYNKGRDHIKKLILDFKRKGGDYARI